jgi:hypothetical protein
MTTGAPVKRPHAKSPLASLPARASKLALLRRPARPYGKPADALGPPHARSRARPTRLRRVRLPLHGRYGRCLLASPHGRGTPGRAG